MANALEPLLAEGQGPADQFLRGSDDVSVAVVEAGTWPMAVSHALDAVLPQLAWDAEWVEPRPTADQPQGNPATRSIIQ
jgi:hypothetical protein